MRFQLRVLFGVIAVATTILVLNLVSTAKPIRSKMGDYGRPNGFLKAGTETPASWDTCLNKTHEHNARFVLTPPRYPKGDPTNVRGSVVVLVQDRLQETIQVLESLEKNFLRWYPYPLFVFHYGISEKDKKSAQMQIRTRITFVKIEKPSPDKRRAAEELLNEPQKSIFSLEMFQHPDLAQFDYIMRVDSVVLSEVINFDPFIFMETNGKVLGVGHWSSDSEAICDGIQSTVDTYKRIFYRWIDRQRDRDFPTSCYGGGAGIFVAFAPFFRSPMVQSFWNYMHCLGGIWTDNWTDQHIMPITLSVIADEPEKRHQYFTNFVVTDLQENLLEPHSTWGTKRWPTQPVGLDGGKIEITGSVSKFNRGCVVFYMSQKDIADVRRSLTNLEFHFLWRFPYPIFIFHKDLSEADKGKVTSGLDPRIVSPIFVAVSVDQNAFYTYHIFEDQALASFAYVMAFDPKTNLLASIPSDPFLLMEGSRFHLAYHRASVPNPELNPAPNSGLWDVAANLQLRLGAPYKERKRPPVDFALALQHWTMISLDFFRQPECLKFMKEIPASSHRSHSYPLAISLFEEFPWRKIADLSSLQMNWNSKASIPFSQQAWRSEQQALWPTWPFQYSNRNPSC